MVETLLDNGNKEWFSDVARMVDKLVVSAFPAEQVSEKEKRFCEKCGFMLTSVETGRFDARTGEPTTKDVCLVAACHDPKEPHDWQELARYKWPFHLFYTGLKCSKCGEEYWPKTGGASDHGC
jgi:hypothetical protein